LGLVIEYTLLGLYWDGIGIGFFFGTFRFTV
jgi:hypothetical protein